MMECFIVGQYCAYCGTFSRDCNVVRSCPFNAGRPGTELAELLKRFGIEHSQHCNCGSKAAEMDAWGCDECSKPERIEEVVAVMREEAKARGLPFIDAVGRMLVKRAIHNARRNAPTPSGPTA
jgi:hypothetical protein